MGNFPIAFIQSAHGLDYRDKPFVMSVKTINYTLNIKNEVNIFESFTTFLLFSVLLTYSRKIFSDVLGISTGRC